MFEIPDIKAVDLADLGDLREAGGHLDAVAVPVYPGGSQPDLVPGTPRTLDVGWRTIHFEVDPEMFERRGFAAKVAQTLVVSAPDVPSIVFVGVGPREDVSPQVLRRVAAAVVRNAGRSGTALMLLPEELARRACRVSEGTDIDRHSAIRCGQVAAEGAVLAAYSYNAYKTATDEEGGRIGTLLFAFGDRSGEAFAEGLRRGVRVARAVCLARDLVNEPPSALTPTTLAEIAEGELTAERGIDLQVWHEEKIASEHLGGLLSVARGSAEPPRLLYGTYEPRNPAKVDGHVPHVVLVGKGITFDSGGLSLKTASGMTTMKTDMSGAAAVIAALSACSDLDVRARVTAIAPVTENMPGGHASKPGDVLTARNGMTIEVLNTDAEGRLVLADGLALAAELEPDAIIDLATLTGACVVALGTQIAGLFTNNDSLADRVRAASDLAGEPTWPLPLPEEYRRHIDSDIADMKNIGKEGQAGAIAAAMLLARFVGDTPWVHLDIAGPARSDEDSGIFEKGGTGFGVRTLLEFLEAFGDRG
ncbi:MAG TPA: leucyl aminopeptidase [Acidimicrobiales bacterium]|nr:leucyl aminopeptidase [Acidimicrobiales bacterium]